MGFSVGTWPRAQGGSPLLLGCEEGQKCPLLSTGHPRGGWKVGPEGSGFSLQFLETTDLDGV